MSQDFWRCGKRAPWTPGEVSALQRRQANPNLHPYTCPTHSNIALVPTESGFECPKCLYHQGWASALDTSGFMDTYDPFDMEGG